MILNKKVLNFSKLTPKKFFSCAFLPYIYGGVFLGFLALLLIPPRGQIFPAFDQVIR